MKSFTYWLASNEWIASKSWRTAADWIVVDYSTFCADSTSSETRISAFLIATGLILWTVRVDSAFWPTCRRTSNISRYARANSLTIDFSALTVLTARWGVARILLNGCYMRDFKILSIWRNYYKSIYKRTLIRSAFDKSVASHTSGTAAHWHVIDNVTNGILSTSTRTRINAFVSNTSFVTRTIRIEDTFWTTSCVWIALVFWQASANTIVAISVWSTWRWITWIIEHGFFGFEWEEYEISKVNYYALVIKSHLVRVLDSNLWMDHQCILECRHKSECDLLHCNLRKFHRSQDKDRGISHWCMPDYLGNQNW